MRAFRAEREEDGRAYRRRSGHGPALGSSRRLGCPRPRGMHVTPPDRPGGSRRPRWLVVAAAALVVAAAGAGAVAVTQPWAPRATPGSTIAIPASEVDGTPIELRVPTGGIELTIGAPVTDAPGVVLGDEPRLLPPRGGAYVPVAITPTAPTRFDATRAPGVDLPTPELAIEVDGLRFDLSDRLAALFGPDGLVRLDGRGVLLAVGSDGPISATLAFDGETQTVLGDGEVELGRFAELLGTSTDEGIGCGPARAEDGYVVLDEEPACELTAITHRPWVGGLGWAPEGGAWTIAVLDLTPPRGLRGPDGELHQRTGGGDAPELTSDGDAPALEFRANAAAGPRDLRDPADPLVAVFATDLAGSPPPIEVTLPLEVASSEPEGRAAATRLTWTVERAR
ncbi:hypothetical protein FTX61_17630 [Nitriliruptoraceae bacterium ZYF776]|nr:hypothetical protein [Profundirhabdus halotolerans]